MALLWLESFDSFGTTNGDTPAPTNVVARKYSAIAGENGMDTEEGHVSGYSMESGANGDRIIVTPILTSCSVMIAGGWFYFSNVMADQSQGALQTILTFNEGTNRSLVLAQTSGGLTVRLGDANALNQIAWTTRYKLQPLEWVFIEMKAYCHNSTGWVVVRINGIEVLTANNVDTQNSTVGYYDRCRFSSADQYTKMDHMYVADTTGSTNNDFLGPLYVLPVRPDGDVTNNFTSGNYASVNKAEDNSGTSNASTNTAGHVLEMSYEATQNFTTIYGVMQCSTASTNANVNLQHTSNDGSTRVDTSNFSINSTNINSYTTRCTVWETDPTGNAWTPGTVNSNAFGIEMQ